MDFMYHVVPQPMIKTVLYPLNVLKEIDHMAYEHAAAKYLADPNRNRHDRRKLMERRVPVLNCLWNDVLHSSTVHPGDLMEMWHNAGYVPKQAISMFEIPLAMLDRENVLIYKHQSNFLKWMRWNYELYDPETYAQFGVISEKAKVTMRKLVARKQIWHFLNIPHVLYRGNIETKGLAVVNVQP